MIFPLLYIEIGMKLWSSPEPINVQNFKYLGVTYAKDWIQTIPGVA